ncbi:hypothetical protein EW026_g7952 [Hermanssonia centrifuga]|uniref:aspartate--tRNA ligase n=1 Tax=Hermanssonia centrifuga TaxID=98765 RepID=A0A4S4K639_9APHY|nr:hypothetical protein EW026_g7952 [Hermanssonia centrifuga]
MAKMPNFIQRGSPDSSPPKRDMSPSPPTSTSSDHEHRKPSRVSTLLSHVRSKSISATRLVSSDTKSPTGSVHQNGGVPNAPNGDAHTEDPLNANYGDLPLNQSQIPRDHPLMGLNPQDTIILAPAPGINGLAHETQPKLSDSPASSSSNSSININTKAEMRPDSGRDMKLTPLKDIEKMEPGQKVAFRARVHHIRPLGSKIVFIILRSQLTTLQGVLAEDPDGTPENEHRVSENMVRWAEGLAREAIVRVVGVVQEPPKEQGQEEVKSASVHKREVKIEQLHVIAKPTAPLPFQVDDISRQAEIEDDARSHKRSRSTDSSAPSPERTHSRSPSADATPDGKASNGKPSKGNKVNHRVGDKTRFANRVLDLRSPPSQAIFRIHSAVCLLFRQVLLSKGFLEIQSSKFQESGTESGASVFKVDYFRRPAFLAQSPQLAKQMCIAADMERVFEIGPVFRAENSNTHRHLTEFTGLDLEMAFETHYHEVLDVIDDTLKYIFKGLQSGYRDEIEAVKTAFPHEDVVILDETPRLKFADGIRMLREAGVRDDDGEEPSEEEDLSTAMERKLGALVKEKYGADYYILDKFPLEVRPFYTMPDPENPKLSNSFDIFLRGEEILSGGQRVHDAPMLEERMKVAGLEPETMIDYVNGFRWGCPPHGGGGVGLERIVMLFLKLGDIRWASLLPRDPKSFTTHGQDPTEASMAAATSMILHGPESKTYQPGHPHGEMPPLENLIAKYGDATNTSWVDPAWTVWRDDTTGAAVGYIVQGGFAVVFGNPLCESSQIPRVVKGFLHFLHSDKANLKPIWCCVDKDTERYLAEELGWSAVIAVAEERVNPIEVDPASQDKTVRRKIHRAEREGVKVHEVEGEPEPEVKKKIEERCMEWAANRKGTQIHLTGVRPFDDVQHRKYFYATDKDGEICSVVVLAQLAAIHGFQIKWALEFSNAPLGAIEYILSYVIKKLGDAGVRTATFGAGASQKLHGVDNVGGGKFGIEQDPLFICYPKGGLGVRGVEAIMGVLQKPK